MKTAYILISCMIFSALATSAFADNSTLTSPTLSDGGVNSDTYSYRGILITLSTPATKLYVKRADASNVPYVRLYNSTSKTWFANATYGSDDWANFSNITSGTYYLLNNVTRGVDNMWQTGADASYPYTNGSVQANVGTILETTGTWHNYTTYWFEIAQIIQSNDTASPPSTNNTLALNAPETGSTYTHYNITFNATPTFYTGTIQNCSLRGNFTGSFLLNKTNTSVMTNATLNNIWQQLTDGVYAWDWVCYNTTNAHYPSNNYTLTINAPEVTPINIQTPSNTTINRYETILLNGTMNCTSGNCLDSKVYIRYGSDSASTYLLNMTNLTKYGKLTISGESNPIIVYPIVKWDSWSNQYKMWYMQRNGSGWNIAYANGSNYTHFTYRGVAMYAGSGWESVAVKGLIVVQHNATFCEAYYEGDNAVDTNTQIGYATSTDCAMNWVKYISNPVILKGTTNLFSGGTQGNIWQPYLWYNGSTRMMYLQSENETLTNGDYRAWILTSNDGYTWNDANNNVSLFSAGSIGDAEMTSPDAVVIQPYNSTHNLTQMLVCTYSHNDCQLMLSYNGKVFTQWNSGSVVLDTGSTWESVRVFLGSIPTDKYAQFKMKDGDPPVLYYSGQDGSGNYQIGMAYVGYTINTTSSSMTYLNTTTPLTTATNPYSCGYLNQTNQYCTWSFLINGTIAGTYNISSYGNSSAFSNNSNYFTLSVAELYTPPATCTDGTEYNYCSVTKPLFCNAGTLVDYCSFCGCAGSLTCNETSNGCYTPEVPVTPTTTAGVSLLEILFPNITDNVIWVMTFFLLFVGIVIGIIFKKNGW